MTQVVTPRTPDGRRVIAVVACAHDQLDAICDRIGTIAERYLRALAIRSRFTHTHARELAEEVRRQARGHAMATGAGRASGPRARAPR